MSVSSLASLATLILIFVYAVALKTVSSERQVFTNTWVIHTHGEESARRIARRHNFVYKGRVGSLKGYFLIEQKAVPRRRRRSTNHHTRRLFSDPEVDWSRQQRAKKRVKRGFTDPLFKDQWYLKNDGQAYGPKGLDINVLPVWKKKITGRGVVVTILDDGIEYHHPDLKRNYDEKASYDYNNNDEDPIPRFTEKNVNKHGTRCAGEVAGDVNNGVCGVGVAYNARIGGIRMLDGDVTDAVEASSLSWAKDHIDIYSSSWGPEDKGMKVDGPATLARRALRDGVRFGRKGLGSIFVWATGNGGDYEDYCNCDGYITSIYTVSIGAVNDQGRSPWYAEPCPSTLAVAFSSGRKGDGWNKKIVTTDLNHACTKRHTGTSAAAPLAAGIFALVLEANPRLTWRDLQHLVVNTSRMTDDADPEWQINGGGYHVNNKYGFGVLNADALVTQAMSPHWKTAPAQHVCREVQFVNNARIPPRGKYTSTIFSTGCSQVHSCVTSLEHVVVHVTLQHGRRGTLEINLVSPAGTKSKLLGLRKLDSSKKGFSNWPFMTVFHWGENPQGTWTIEVVSTEDYRGTFKRWALRLYGTCSTVKNRSVNEQDVCNRYCQKGCTEPFSKVYGGRVKYCDCTTGRCTTRCPRGLETDPYRRECSNNSRSEPIANPSNTNRSTGRSFPRYGQWLLVAAGVAVAFGVLAGVWQGWLYYKTRKKLLLGRRQHERQQYSTSSRYTIATDVEHASLTST